MFFYSNKSQNFATINLTDITKRVSAVIFDLDGVLVLTPDTAFQAYKWALEQSDPTINFTVDDYKPLTGAKPEQKIAILRAKYPSVNPEQVMRCKDAKYEELLAKGVPPITEAIDLLKRLNKIKVSKGFKVCLASSGDIDEIKQKLKSVDLQVSDFDVIGSGSYLSEGNKNKKEVYDYIASQLGVAPAECVVFEDSDTGAKAAVDAGMVVIAVPNKFTQDHKFPSKAYVGNFEAITYEKSAIASMLPRSRYIFAGFALFATAYTVRYVSSDRGSSVVSSFNRFRRHLM